MAVVISNSMVVGKLNAGKLRTRNPGDIDAPNQLTAEQAHQIAEANGITPEQVADLGGPDLIQAIAASNLAGADLINSIAATNIGGPQLVAALSAAGISGPQIIAALTASEIETPNELTSEQAAQIAEANTLTTEQVSELDAPSLVQAIAASSLDGPDLISALSSVNIDGPDLISALSAANLSAPQLIDALSAEQIQAPTQISSEQASQIQAAREVDAISAASISAPNQINAIPDNTSPPFDMRHARILYDNVLSDASGSALVRSPNTYEKATGTTFTLTMPSNRPIDCISALGVFEGVTVTLEYSTTTGDTFATIASVTPNNNRPIMVFFDEFSARRIRITLSSPRAVINLSAGIALQMQRPIFGGHNPITMSRQTEYQSRRSESGNFVSRNIIRKGLSGSYEWSNLTDDWVREYFDPFIIAARKVPFYIAWRPGSYPDEVAYAWTTGDISPNNIGTRNLMSVGMDVQAYGD